MSSYSDVMGALDPDWSDYMTIVKAELELRGFKYAGPGWYVMKHDTLLVQTIEEPQVLGKLIWIYCWNGRYPSDEIDELAKILKRIPVITDSRIK